MPYPQDLDDVAVFKVHPAIGVARLANNDDYYEFFESEAEREEGDPLRPKYMSEHNGVQVVMRQAVQFSIFAYDGEGNELGRLTEELADDLGLSVSWSADIANRKLDNWSGGQTPAVEASGTAAGSAEVRLEGKNPWHDGKVWLGSITGSGLFVPPKGGVYREDEQKRIPPYSGNWNRDNGVLDTTSDGAITAIIGDIGEIPIVPAAIIVAPQQHSPDVNPGDINDFRNQDLVKVTRQVLGIPADASLNGLGYAMDLAMMSTMAGEHSPGVEICYNPTNALPDARKAFFPRHEGHIHEFEIRPRYVPGEVEFGALTAGLCSTWQTDLDACLNYWTAQFPNRVRFDVDRRRRFLSRKEYAVSNQDPDERMEDNEDLNKYFDMMGIARNTASNVGRLKETERTPNDNAGPTPQGPFPLEPDQ